MDPQLDAADRVGAELHGASLGFQLLSLFGGQDDHRLMLFHAS